MKKSLEFIINSILGTNDIKVFEEETPSGIVLTIEPASQDIGKIIGKKGKIIKAIRKLLSVRAAKEKKRIDIKIKGESQNEKGLVLTEEGGGKTTGNSPQNS